MARGRRVHCAAFTLQAARTRAGEAGDPAPSGVRFGLTVTKKVGTATERNRIRRRFREVIRLAMALPTEPGTDYVIVARRDALGSPFGQLAEELEKALRRSSARKPRTAPADARASGLTR